MEEEKRNIYKGYYLMLLEVEGEHEDDEMGYAVSIQNKEYEQYEMTWVMDRPEFAKKWPVI